MLESMEPLQDEEVPTGVFVLGALLLVLVLVAFAVWAGAQALAELPERGMDWLVKWQQRNGR